MRPKGSLIPDLGFHVFVVFFHLSPHFPIRSLPDRVGNWDGDFECSRKVATRESDPQSFGSLRSPRLKREDDSKLEARKKTRRTEIMNGHENYRLEIEVWEHNARDGNYFVYTFLAF